MGLAFWRADLGGHPAVEHQGTLPGFHSQLFLAPDDGVGVMAFTNGSWRSDFWLPAEVLGLLGSCSACPRRGSAPTCRSVPEIWGDLCGWYALAGPLSDVRVRRCSAPGSRSSSAAGQLMLRVLTPIPTLYRGFPLHPDDEDDPYVFRVELMECGLDAHRVRAGPGAGTTALHVELMPLSLRKQTAATNPRVWASGALGSLAAGGAAAVVRHQLATRRGERHA